MDASRRSFFLYRQQGFFQLIPMIILGILTISMFIIVGMVGKNQENRSSAVYGTCGVAGDLCGGSVVCCGGLTCTGMVKTCTPTSNTPTPILKCCPRDPYNNSQVNTCKGIAQTPCTETYKASCEWVSVCPTVAPTAPPVTGKCCPRDPLNNSQVNTCTGLSNNNCTGTYSSSCLWAPSGNCQTPGTTTTSPPVRTPTPPKPSCVGLNVNCGASNSNIPCCSPNMCTYFTIDGGTYWCKAPTSALIPTGKSTPSAPVAFCTGPNDQKRG